MNLITLICLTLAPAAALAGLWETWRESRRVTLDREAEEFVATIRLAREFANARRRPPVKGRATTQETNAA